MTAFQIGQSFPKSIDGLRRAGLLATLVITLTLLGCGKKTVVTNTPPPPPPPPVPTASIDVSPSTVEAGQSSTITWKTRDATQVSIEPLGPVDANGTKDVAPTESVTYRLVAKGPGGVQEAVARITFVTRHVTASAPPEELLLDPSGRQDIFFDTDDFRIRPDQQSTLSGDASFLKQHPDLRIVVEGHCDELGSIEYNLALGEKRAGEVRNALIEAGVGGDRINTISYGKERPFCDQPSEECWKQNRRAHLTPSVDR